MMKENFNPSISSSSEISKLIFQSVWQKDFLKWCCAFAHPVSRLEHLFVLGSKFVQKGVGQFNTTTPQFPWKTHTKLSLNVWPRILPWVEKSVAQYDKQMSYSNQLNCIYIILFTNRHGQEVALKNYRQRFKILNFSSKRNFNKHVTALTWGKNTDTLILNR